MTGRVGTKTRDTNVRMLKIILKWTPIDSIRLEVIDVTEGQITPNLHVYYIRSEEDVSGI